MKCRRCGNVIPDGAAECPMCGASAKRKRRWPIVAVIVVVVLAIAVLGMNIVNKRLYPFTMEFETVPKWYWQLCVHGEWDASFIPDETSIYGVSRPEEGAYLKLNWNGTGEMYDGSTLRTFKYAFDGFDQIVGSVFFKLDGADGDRLVYSAFIDTMIYSMKDGEGIWFDHDALIKPKSA